MRLTIEEAQRFPRKHGTDDPRTKLLNLASVLLALTVPRPTFQDSVAETRPQPYSTASRRQPNRVRQHERPLSSDRARQPTAAAQPIRPPRPGRPRSPWSVGHGLKGRIWTLQRPLPAGLWYNNGIVISSCILLPSYPAIVSRTDGCRGRGASLSGGDHGAYPLPSNFTSLVSGVR